MKNNKEFNASFNKAYKKVATTAIYSMKIATQIGYGTDIRAIDMPEEMTSCVEKHGGGCCFHHSWRLIHELTNAGIPAYWAVVPEPSESRPKDQKCVVVYETPDGSRYVADVVEDIKAGVRMTDFINDSGCKWINGSGEIIDNSRIDLEHMVLISDNPITPGYLKIYPKPVGDESFDTFRTETEYELITIDDVKEYEEEMISERQQKLMSIMHTIGDCNPSIDLSFTIANGYDGQAELFLTGKVEGRSLKFPRPNWRFSQKNGGTVVGPSLPVHYEKDWRYKLKKINKQGNRNKQ